MEWLTTYQLKLFEARDIEGIRQEIDALQRGLKWASNNEYGEAYTDLREKHRRLLRA